MTHRKSSKILFLNSNLIRQIEFLETGALITWAAGLGRPHTARRSGSLRNIRGATSPTPHLWPQSALPWSVQAGSVNGARPANADTQRPAWAQPDLFLGEGNAVTRRSVPLTRGNGATGSHHLSSQANGKVSLCVSLLGPRDSAETRTFWPHCNSGMCVSSGGKTPNPGTPGPKHRDAAARRRD